MKLHRINTAHFNRAMRSLATLSGVPLQGVLDAEAQKILAAAVRFTPAAEVAAIKDRENNRDFRTLDVGSGRKTYFLGNRYPDALWQAIERRRKERLLKTLRARGLSKRSWVSLGEAAGLHIAAPGYVRRAVAVTGRTYPGNFTAVRRSGPARCGLYFANAQPTVNRYPAMQAALRRAVRGRVKYFETSLRKGAFTSIARIARAYPGLRLHAP